jgi:hypothetical protein
LNSSVSRLHNLLYSRDGSGETRVATPIRNPTEPRHPDLEKPLVYGVGDVHGMSDLLSHLLVEIKADAASYGRAAKVVFLGDVVNRGAKTKQVLDRLVAGLYLNRIRSASVKWASLWSYRRSVQRRSASTIGIDRATHPRPDANAAGPPGAVRHGSAAAAVIRSE